MAELKVTLTGDARGLKRAADEATKILTAAQAQEAAVASRTQAARKAAYDAKNRYDLPDSLALDWAEFETAARAHRPADPRALEAAIREAAALLDDKTKTLVLEALKRADGNASKLAQLNSFTNQKVSEATNG